MELMAEKDIRGGISHSVYWYAEANNNYMKDYDKNKESSYLQHWNLNSLSGLDMPQKLPVKSFEWIEDTSLFSEDFIKNITKKVIKDIFSKLMFNILKNYMKFIMIYLSYLRGWKLKKSRSLWLIYLIKLNML